MNYDDNKILYKIGWAILILAFGVFLLIKASHINLGIFMLPCLFHELTGLYCPGCGGTRSVLALLHGHLLLSIRLNPIVMYVTVLYIWYMLSNTIEYLTKHRIRIGLKYRDAYFWVGLIIVLVFFVFRDFLLIVYGIDLTSL